MAVLRKAHAYSKKHVVPYTRISKQKKYAYAKVVPPAKIVKFNMGNLKGNEAGKFPHLLTLVTDENVQIRQNALEACRQFLDRKLNDEMSGQYFFRVIPYTHHIQRENKMLTGAGADRTQKGMQLSFGRSIAKAAILKDGNGIMSVAVATPKAASFVRKIFKQIKSKLPCKTKIVYEFTQKSVA
ncbi:50S ribosomal protein L10e [uncultured archaeon]|nr:50S ribosomal protein L10e [uncultured archaeon]